MRLRAAVLVALTAAAGWLRFASIGFGLPDKLRPDEEYVVSRALGFDPDWNPHFAIYPALEMYVLHGALRLAAAAEGDADGFRRRFGANGAAPAHRAGRLLSATFGTLTVPAVYLAGARALGPFAALAAAAITTFATLHVRESKFATTDAAAVLLTALACWMMLRVVIRGGLRDSTGAGLLAGLATAAKYPAGAVLAGVGLAHLGARRREGRSLWRIVRDIRPYLALYAAVVAFLAGTPYFLLDWQRTVSDFRFQREFLAHGVGNPLVRTGWRWLLFDALPDGYGPTLAALLVAGFLWALVRPRPGRLSLAGAAAVACAGMTASSYVFYRYAVMPLPELALLAGALVGDAAEGLGRRIGGRRARIAAAAALAAALAPSLVRDYKLDRLLGRRDTRTIAREWIEAHVPAGAAIAATAAATPYGKPALGRGRRYVPFLSTEAARRAGIEWVLSDSSPLAFYSPGPTPAQLGDLERNAELVFDRDPVKPGTPAPVFDQNDAFYAPLRHASSMKRPGPRIRIWRLRRSRRGPARATRSTRAREGLRARRRPGRRDFAAPPARGERRAKASGPESPKPAPRSDRWRR